MCMYGVYVCRCVCVRVCVSHGKFHQEKHVCRKGVGGWVGKVMTEERDSGVDTVDRKAKQRNREALAVLQQVAAACKLPFALQNQVERNKLSIHLCAVCFYSITLPVM